MFFFERLKLSLGRKEGGKGMPCTAAEGHGWMMVGGGSGFIPAPALQPGWGSKLGLLEGLEELQGEESQNRADGKRLQPWSPALKSHLWPKVGRDLAGRASQRDGAAASPSRSQGEGQELGGQSTTRSSTGETACV